VVEGNGKRLAIECDGEKFHPPEALAADLERQAILERLGWKFVRIRGSVFYREPEKAMAAVFARLEQIGIQPDDTKTSQANECNASADNIRRSAEMIRRKWLQETLSE
jgi:REase_MTES_1575